MMPPDSSFFETRDGEESAPYWVAFVPAVVLKIRRVAGCATTWGELMFREIREKDAVH